MTTPEHRGHTTVSVDGKVIGKVKSWKPSTSRLCPFFSMCSTEKKSGCHDPKMASVCCADYQEFERLRSEEDAI
jgi:hypothetical protein